MTVVDDYSWFRPEDLPTLFNSLLKVTPPAILVGGQSLTFWVDYFGIAIPRTDTPYLTQDADIFASRHDAEIIAQHLKFGKVVVADNNDATVSNAIITYYSGDRKLLIDVMGVLCGLDHDEILQTALTMELPYGQLNVLHPRLVLKSRICNLEVIKSKRDTNGITQAKLAIKVYRAFLNAYRDYVDTNTDYQNFLLDKAEELKEISLSKASIFVFKEYGINVLDSFPVELVENETFHEKQWPNIIRWFNNKAQA